MPSRAELIQQVLSDVFGFPGLKPEQEPVVHRVLGIGEDSPEGGGDAMVVMPTGSGKSLCYQLPALVRAREGERDSRGVTLVFSPLIALMEDQVSALRAKGVRAAYINSTVGRKERDTRYRALAEGAYDLIYATPERMEKDDFRRALEAVPGGVNLLAIDEAHCVSKWGHDLRPAYQRVGEFREQLGSPRTITLTATATKAVREDIRSVLGLDDTSMPLFATGIERPNLLMRVEPAWDDSEKIERIATIASGFCDGAAGGTGIVYFALIKDLERMMPEIRRAVEKTTGGRLGVGLYHGRLDARQKRRVYQDFISATPAKPLLLCATNAFGMGVDKPDIRFIVHAQVPGSVEAYYQEIGRAGRDGEPSACVLLYAQEDLAIQHEFVRWQNPSADLLMGAMSAIARRYGGEDASGHGTFDADDIRLDVIGKGHAHGMGGGVVEYALIGLAKRGAIEEVGPSEKGGNLYRFVRELDDSEIDAEEIKAKTTRDLSRLLEVVKMTQADSVAGFLEAYFD